MAYDIRIAGLNDEQERCVRGAAMRLQVFKLATRVSSWDGTRCDLLVAAADDIYGFQMLRVAKRHHVPILPLGNPLRDLGVHGLPAAADPAMLAKLMRRQFEGESAGEASPMAADATKGGQKKRRSPALCRLAGIGRRGKPVNATRLGRTLMLRPERGRVFAHSHSDLLTGIESFFEPGWSISVVSDSSDFADNASASLESFLLRAAYRGKQHLPDFPSGEYRLAAWPDLGTMPSLLSVLHIAKKLVAGPVSPDDLMGADGCGKNRANINACLWGLAAADLLISVAADTKAPVAAPAVAAPRRRLGRGVWTSIARRFGLLAQ